MERHMVVVVEDDPVQRMGAVQAFRDSGFETAEFDNAEAAAVFIRDRQDDILAIFTDVRMPGDLDGINLAAQVAFGCPQIMLLITSGHTEGVLERLPPNGYFVPKPWQAADLASAIGHLQDRRAAIG